MYNENNILLKKFGTLTKKLHKECFFAVFGGFAGLTGNNDLFYVQIKEDKKVRKKYFMSCFPPE